MKTLLGVLLAINLLVSAVAIRGWYQDEKQLNRIDQDRPAMSVGVTLPCATDPKADEDGCQREALTYIATNAEQVAKDSEHETRYTTLYASLLRNRYTKDYLNGQVCLAPMAAPGKHNCFPVTNGTMSAIVDPRVCYNAVIAPIDFPAYSLPFRVCPIGEVYSLDRAILAAQLQ